MYASAVEWPSVLAVAAVALALIALAETAAERRGILLVPGFVLCLLSAAMVTYLLARDDYAFAVPSLLYTGYYLFLAMVYLALGPIAATTDANPTRLFSSAMLANVGGLLLGSIIAGTERWFGAQGTALTVLAVTYALLVAGFLLLGSKSYSLFRVNNFDEALDEAFRAEHGCQHSAMIHSSNVHNMSRAARRMNTTIFVKNAPSYSGLGFGGEGYTTLTIATPTGEGLTSAKSFTRARRCVLKGDFRII